MSKLAKERKLLGDDAVVEDDGVMGVDGERLGESEGEELRHSFAEVMKMPRNALETGWREVGESSVA